MTENSIQDTDIWAYVAQSADEPTRAKVEQWKSSKDFDEEAFNAIVKVYHATGKNPFEYTIDVDAAKAEFFTSIKSKQNQRSGPQKYLKYAAAIVLLLTIVGITYEFSVKETITIVTTYGEKKEVALPDGSVVWLNASSTLSYKEDAPRTLQLNGEGFFQVAKDSAHPFTVETPDHVIVKALGTSFNVKAYPANTYLETSLLTGKVEVSSKKYFDEKVLLLPNEKVTVHKADGIPRKTTIQDQQDILVWRSGKLRFQNRSFKDIASDLHNALNVQLIFRNEAMANTKFTATFEPSTTIAEILEVLKTSKEFMYHQNQETNEWIIE